MIYYDVENDILLTEAELKADFEKYHNEFLTEFNNYDDFVSYMLMTGALSTVHYN